MIKLGLHYSRGSSHPNGPLQVCNSEKLYKWNQLPSAQLAELGGWSSKMRRTGFGEPECIPGKHNFAIKSRSRRLHKAGFIENIERLGRYSRETILISRDVITHSMYTGRTAVQHKHTPTQLNYHTCGLPFGPNEYSKTSTNTQTALQKGVGFQHGCRKVPFISQLGMNILVPRV